tara:strand:- start:1013 stop:1459 length:447 start_codon:yes stop_codon:yes gene_type:complete
MMKELEFDVTLEDDDLFDDSAYGELVKEHSQTSLSKPKQEFLLTKGGLADLTRSAIRDEHLKKKADDDEEEETPQFRKKVSALADNAIEWCNYTAQCGEWRHVYDMGKIEAKLFKPTMREIRLRMKDVIIIVQEKQQKLTIEWGKNGA